MSIRLRRREFITLIGGAAAWPLAARAQQQAVPVVGFLNGNSPEAGPPLLVAFRQGLAEERFIDGENVTILPLWADNQYDRLPALAMELVSRRVAVIAAGTPPAAQAAKATTSTIPIVFTTGIDAVGLGLVSSLSRGREHHWDQLSHQFADDQTTGIAPRSSASSRLNRRASKS